MKLKLMIVVGTRPEIIRLSEVIKLADQCFDMTLVHTGQNYDYNLNEVFFKDFGLRAPDYYLDAPGSDLGETVGNIIARSYKLISEVQPDALLVLGDTNSCLAAYAAKRLKVPVFHMEAGNRCFDFKVPEETNRRVVDQIADINLAYTENARRYLISEGFNRDNVYVTGSPMTEVLAANAAAIAGSDVLARMGLEAGGYFVVSMHREENVDNPERLAGLVAALNAVAAQYGKPLVFSCHPRTRGRLSASGLELDALVREVEPLDFFDYNKLQQDAYCVLSDSGTVPEEGAILGFPAVSMRDSTERPEALDGGGVVLGGVDVDGILGAIELAVKLGVRTHGVALPESPEPYDACAVRDYRDTNVAEKVVKIIASYTRIVAGRVWGRG